MFTKFYADCINTVYYQVGSSLVTSGQKVAVRNTETVELHPCAFTIGNPKKRTLLFDGRDNNPFATLFETLWVLSGRTDIQYLSFFLPRAIDFSDDGQTWRAGYGGRIMNNPDQLKYVYEVLKKDLYSRRALISLWRPELDSDHRDSFKDYCCTNTVNFLVREGKLDCTVYMRSNDLLWGCSSINIYEFTVMQEILARLLKVEVGQYHHFANSMHLYTKGFNGEKNFPKVVDSMVNADKNLKRVLNTLHNAGVVPYEFPISFDNTYDTTLFLYNDNYAEICALIDELSNKHSVALDFEANECFIRHISPFNIDSWDHTVLLRLYVMYQVCKKRGLMDKFKEIYAIFLDAVVQPRMGTKLCKYDLYLSCIHWLSNKLGVRVDYVDTHNLLSKGLQRELSGV